MVSQSPNDLVEVVIRESGLAADRAQIMATLDAFGEGSGRRYISVESGKNMLPLMAALRGFEVVAFVTDTGALDYQFQRSREYSGLLGSSGGRFTVAEGDVVEDTSIRGRFNVVECVNLGRKYDEREVAQVLLSFGDTDAKFLASLFGGPTDQSNALVRSLLSESEGGGRKLRVSSPRLYSSTVGNTTASLLAPYSNS